MKKTIISLFIIFFFLAATTCHAAVIFVKSDAVGAWNGTSWDTAYISLQSALGAAVSGDEIWVAAGTYTPGIERTDSFSLKYNVKVYGGFQGTEANRDNRDWVNNQTILSGDIGQPGVDTDNCYHVFYHLQLNLTSSSVLDGFIITGGNSYYHGGGMYNFESSPAITNCTFKNNRALQEGGGIYNEKSSLTIVHCSFIDNTVGGAGGGISNKNSTTIILECSFVNNKTGDYGEGAGIRNFRSESTIQNCSFINNSAGANYGLGGGICNKDSRELSTITNSFFSNNSAMDGGGLRGGKQRITNCVFWKNTADYQGGGISGTSETFVTNSILWANGLDQISGAVKVSFSNVQGGLDGAGNINQDPLFVDPEGNDDIPGTMDDDFHLKPNSPCVDAGSNGAWSLPEKDFESDLRIMDGNKDTILIVDMGVDEFGGNAEFFAPSEVWVDDDWQTAKAGDIVQEHIFGVNAFYHIQHAINVLAVPGTISLASGTFYENFIMKSGVKIFGDNKNTTIIDGMDEGPVVTAIDVDHTGEISNVTLMNGKSSTGGGLRLKNSYIIITECNIAGNDAYYRYTIADTWYSERQKARGGGAYILKGAPSFQNCTFLGNKATAANGQDTYGGGIYCENASPILYDCIFKDNYTQHDGGGMYNLDATPFLTDCTFKNNHVMEDGGGMYNYNSNLRLEGGKFIKNSASEDGGGMYSDSSEIYIVYGIFDENSAHAGGGMSVKQGSLTVKESAFLNNLAKSNYENSGTAGGVYAIDTTAMFSYCKFLNNRAITNAASPSFAGARAGGLFSSGGNQTISYCLFKNNSADTGGGIVVKNNVIVLASSILENNTADIGGGAYLNGDVNVVNTIFNGNSGNYKGGGAVINDSDATLINCSFYGNSALKGNGIYCGFINDQSPNKIQIINSIMWNGGDEIFHTDNDEISVTYSDVQNGFLGQGNMDKNPMFASPDEGNFHLLAASPCIDAGNNVADGLPDDDFDKEPRIMASKENSSMIVDMGADELSDPTSLWVLGTTPEGIIDNGIGHLDVTFTTSIKPATFTADDIQISLSTGEQLTTQISFLKIVGNYEVYRVSFPKQEKGMILIDITPDIQGINGSLLNQDYDNIPGEPVEDAYESYIFVVTSEYELKTGISPEKSGFLAVEPLGTTYIKGSEVILTAEFASGYIFDFWSGDVDGTLNPKTIIMDNNKIVIANFKINLLKGDINADTHIDLTDAVIALKILTGIKEQNIRPDYNASIIDVNGDNQVGAAELIYILQKIAGLTPANE